jgi:hypothetical protein
MLYLVDNLVIFSDLLNCMKIYDSKVEMENPLQDFHFA